MQRRQQSGISYMGFMIFVVIFATIIKVGATISGPYYDNYTINKMIESLFRDGRTTTVEDFKRGLSNSFSINGIRDKTPDDFKYVYEDKKLTVEVDYEVRRNFVGNIDVVMHFKQTHGRELKTEY